MGHHWTAQDYVYVIAECVIGVFSVVGNILVLVSIKRVRALQTVTNHFIGSLAAADVLVGLFIPPSVVLSYLGLPNSLHGCVLLNSGVVLFTNISILSLLIVALDRFLAISKPFLYQRIMRKRWAKLVVAVTWVVATLIGLIPLMGWHKGEEDFVICAFILVIDLRYMVYLIFFGMTVPLLLAMLLIYLYIFYIIDKLQRTMAIQTRAVSQVKAGKHTQEIKGAVGLALVIILFAVCWLPIHIMNCVSVFAPEKSAPFAWLLVAITLSHANSCVNPFLYAFSNSKFKFAMIDMLHCKKLRDIDRDSRKNSTMAGVLSK